MSPALDRLLRRSARGQNFLFSSFALVCLAFGFVVCCGAPLLPAKTAADRRGRVVVMAFGALAAPTGVGFGLWSWRRTRKVRALLERPQDIARVQLVQVSGNGLTTYGVWFHTRDGRVIAQNVQSAATLRELVEELSAHLPGVPIDGP